MTMSSSFQFLFLFFLFGVGATSATLFSKNELRYAGRFDMNRDYPAGDWSGSGITMFVETAASTDGKTEMVDMSLTNNIGAVTGSTEMLFYVVDSSMTEIHIIKLTEGAYSDNQGELALSGYTLSNNAQMVTQQVDNNVPKSCRNPNKLNLLIIGDSITAAYGVDGVDPCSYSASSQNFMHSYAYLTAQALGAELTTLGWSGKGVVRNYGDVNPTSTNPMPTYYNRTLAPLSNDNSPLNYWDPSRYSPDVVLVMLGTNDYSTNPNPSDEDFTNGLVDFITVISKDYPSALLGAMCAPSNRGRQCANIENATKLTGSTFVSMNSSLYVQPNGCDGHPSIATQQNIADVVIPTVRGMLSAQKL